MPFLEKLAKSVVNVINDKSLLRLRLPISYTSSYRCVGSKVSADDLRSLPEKPKKPLTPYFKFMVNMRPEVKKEHPDSKLTDVVKLLAEKWEKFPIEAKQKYMEDYKKDLVEYMSEKNKYESKLTDEHKQLMKRAKEEMVIAKENKKLRKKMRELGKPKKPASPFLAFFNSKIPSRGETPYKEWVKGTAKEWSNMPPELKASFQKEYNLAMESYRRQLQEWEERMVRMGHIDVVRSEALIEPKKNLKKTVKTRLAGRSK